ncbi:MAG: MFS transporter [Chloroflexota bacterium]
MLTNPRNLTILLGSTTTVLAATIISPALPGMAAAFADTPDVDFLVRLTLTMPALFIAVGALFAGVLLDRIGRRPVLLASLVLYGIAGTAGFFLNSLVAILVSRALLGLAVAGIMSGFTTLILDYFQGSDLNKFLGLQGAFIGLGGMLFLLAGGFLAEIGWEYPFLIHLFAFLIVPGVLWSIVEPEQTAVSNTPTTNTTSPFPWRKLLPIYVTAFVGMVVFFIFPVQIPFYLAESGDVSSSQVGLALSLNTLASVVFALQYQRLKERFSFQFIFALIFLTFSLNHFIVAASSSYLIVVIGLLVGGVGIGLFPPNNSGWLATLASAEIRGKAVGIMTSMIFLGQFFSPILTQPLVTRLGLAGTFAAVGGVALFITLLFAMGAARQKETAVPAIKNS